MVEWPTKRPPAPRSAPARCARRAAGSRSRRLTARGRPGAAHPRRPRRRVLARASSARRARRSSSCTTTPTGCGRRWSSATACSSRSTGTRRSPRSRTRLLPLIDRARPRRVARLPRQPGRAQPGGDDLQPGAHHGARHTQPLLGLHGRPDAQGSVGGATCSVARRRCPVPDLDRTDYLVMLGANPYASNGSLCTAPDFPGRLEAIQARGGTLVVVDPRRTETAERPTEHIASGPAPTPCLLAAIVNVLFAEGLVDPGALSPTTSTGSTSCAAARAVHARGRRRGDAASTPTTIRRARPRARRGAHRRGLRPHRHLHAASSARSPRGWSTSSTS